MGGDDLEPDKLLAHCLRAIPHRGGKRPCSLGQLHFEIFSCPARQRLFVLYHDIDFFAYKTLRELSKVFRADIGQVACASSAQLGQNPVLHDCGGERARPLREGEGVHIGEAVPYEQSLAQAKIHLRFAGEACYHIAPQANQRHKPCGLGRNSIDRFHAVRPSHRFENHVRPRLYRQVQKAADVFVLRQCVHNIKRLCARLYGTQSDTALRRNGCNGRRQICYAATFRRVQHEVAAGNDDFVVARFDKPLGLVQDLRKRN